MRKRALVVFLVVMMVASVACAEKVSIMKLRVDRTMMDNYKFVSGTVVTTDSVYMPGNTGFANLVIATHDTLNPSGFDVDISMEVSPDKVNWFTPKTTDGTSLTEVGAVATQVEADAWIILTSRLSKYTRFVFDPDKTCTTDSVYFMHLEDN